MNSGLDLNRFVGVPGIGGTPRLGMNFLWLLRGRSPFSKTFPSPLLPVLLIKSSARAGMGDSQRFQILPYPADIMATSKTLYIPFGFGNNFATNSSRLHINYINFPILPLLINYISRMPGRKCMYRNICLPPSSQQSPQTIKQSMIKIPPL